MIRLLWIGLVTVVAALVVLRKTLGKAAPKAKKAEKSEILKQLLALSDRENAPPLPPLQHGRAQPAARGRARAKGAC